MKRQRSFWNISSFHHATPSSSPSLPYSSDIPCLTLQSFPVRCREIFPRWARSTLSLLKMALLFMWRRALDVFCFKTDLNVGNLRCTLDITRHSGAGLGKIPTLLMKLLENVDFFLFLAIYFCFVSFCLFRSIFLCCRLNSHKSTVNVCAKGVKHVNISEALSKCCVFFFS